MRILAYIGYDSATSPLFTRQYLQRHQESGSGIGKSALPTSGENWPLSMKGLGAVTQSQHVKRLTISGVAAKATC